MSDSGVSFMALVIPDLGKTFGGGVESVTPILWLIILSLTISVLIIAVRRTRNALALVGEAHTLTAGTPTDETRTRRAELALKAQRQSRVVRHAWEDFDGTLVSTETKVFASVPADTFFTEQGFAPGLVGNRVLGSVPTVLTTLGLFGTFLGLTVGLRELDLGSTAEELRVGIQTLVDGAALGFTASLWGVSMSLLTNVVLRFCERRVLERLRKLQAQIDGIFPLKAPEQSLSDIAYHSAESNEALQVLHEKIGTALQETVQRMGEETSRAVSESVSAAIHDSLTPIMRDLAERSVEHSAKVFEKVSAELTSSFREMGLSLADELKSSSEAMRVTLDRVGADLVLHSDNHAKRLDAMQVASLESAQRLQESSTQALSELQAAAAEHLADVRKTTAQQLEQVQSVAAEQARHMQETSTKTLDDLQRSSAQHLEELRGATVDQMTELRTAASTQLTAVNDATERQVRMLDESLPKVVAGLEKAANVVGAATGGMESISENLSRVATEIGGTSTTLAGMLVEAIGTMGELADKTAQAASTLAEQQSAVADMSQRTAASVDALQKASGLLQHGFTTMRTHQDSFLESLNRQLVDHSRTTAGWLADYADQVSKQTGRRMDEWNDQTGKFTSNMLAAIEALSHAIDEYDTIRKLRDATEQVAAA